MNVICKSLIKDTFRWNHNMILNFNELKVDGAVAINGVRQWSGFGPILFILFISDFLYFLFPKLFLFVDDKNFLQVLY